MIFRLGFAATRAEARQLVLHKHVLVNGKRVNVPSFLVKVGDKVSIREKSQKIPRIKESVEGAERRGVITWMELDKANFLGTVNVTVGGVACTGITVTSSTTLTCTVPASGSAGAKMVSVISTTHGNGFLANAFTHNPSPTISSISPPGGPLAGGTLVTITGTNFFPTVNVSFGNLAARQLHRSFIQARDELKLTAPASSLGGKIFPKRIPFCIILWQQDAPQIRMTGEADPHHVVDLALKEFGALPDGGHRSDGRIVLGYPSLDAETAPV